MSLRLEAVAFEVADPAAVAAFWAGLLDREVVPEARGALLPGDRTQVGLRFAASGTEQLGPRRLHLHLTSGSTEQQQRTVGTALRLGGRRIDTDPEDRHVVLADPGGNELCVIEPGNTFLAGCGFLGEVTCDGTRQVGLFWRDALGWPLVWDEGEQTAVQSPLGGTKISWDAWSGREYAGHRQRFDLVAADPAGEAGRLVPLGATRLRDLPDGVELADPDGTEFRVRAG